MDMDKGLEPGLQLFDPGKMGFDHIHR